MKEKERFLNQWRFGGAYREARGKTVATGTFVIRTNSQPPKFANAIAAIISGITARNFPIFRDKHVAKFNAALAANFPPNYYNFVPVTTTRSGY